MRLSPQLHRPIAAAVLSWLIALLCVTVPVFASQQASTRPTPQDVRQALVRDSRPVQGAARLVPERFLRAWDPLTVFFASATGPRSGPEANPLRYVQLTPQPAGAWTWIDPQTLTFRPAEPWPQLETIEARIGNTRYTLHSLLDPPTGTEPQAGKLVESSLDQVTLTFKREVSVEALRAQLRGEILPLAAGGQVQRFSGADADLRVKPARSDDTTWRYTLRLPAPAGPGCLVKLLLPLTTESKLSEHLYAVEFLTAPAFRLLAVGGKEQRSALQPGITVQVPDVPLGEPLVLEFSAAVGALDDGLGRNLLSFEPPVTNLSFTPRGVFVDVSGDFQEDVAYRLSARPSPLFDLDGRPLNDPTGLSAHLRFVAKVPFLRVLKGQVIGELSGPVLLPIESRGMTQADVRVYPLQPDENLFWPFPQNSILIDESTRPPGPGENSPDPRRARPIGQLDAQAIGHHILNLPPPPVSELVSLPVQNRSASRSGIDLAPLLSKARQGSATTQFLVGVRGLDYGSQRYWSLVQVTDLGLSVITEPGQGKFLVTSLKSAKPVAGASIRIEGIEQGKLVTLAETSTAADGTATLKARQRHIERITRVSITSAGDTLRLDPTLPLRTFNQDYWQDYGGDWLYWLFQNPHDPRETALTKGHIFTERPIYRPGEKVYIKGYVRDLQQGEIRLVPGTGTVRISGPSGQEWLKPVTLNEFSAFDTTFQEQDAPTGYYTVEFFSDDFTVVGGVCSFQYEAYRLPTFEVEMPGPRTARMDEPFTVQAFARYYSGGSVNEQPVQWRATKFPLTWTPKREPGFFYSTHSLFSRSTPERDTTGETNLGKTDKTGAASFTLDPSKETTARPLTYVIEATVTGADDMTVTATKRVNALPSRVIGMKLERHVPSGYRFPVTLQVTDSNGSLVQGETVELRLYHKRWLAALQASDFAGGEPRYITETVEDEVSSETLTTDGKLIQKEFTVQAAGVYLVEATCRDAVGRVINVKVDLFVQGETPVSWSKPIAEVFRATPLKNSYVPGETAEIILESPFQNALAVACIEHPTGFRYEYLQVQNGKAVFRLPVEARFVPRIPVNFLLIRGRLDTAAPPTAKSPLDLGRPQVVAATATLTVEPVQNRLTVGLTHPDRTQPGQEIEVTVTLQNHEKQPVAGEVALWLVDEAVLALGGPQELDPLPSFLADVYPMASIRDTRELLVGRLPTVPLPGGDGASGRAAGAGMMADAAALMEKVTVRKNFQTVPIFLPSLLVDASGTATAKVQLPDNLTNFKVRAVAVSGPDRFGLSSSTLEVRLPVLVQPSLPRFLRYGDEAGLLALVRAIDGNSGEVQFRTTAQGVELRDADLRKGDLNATLPTRFLSLVQAPPAASGTDQHPDGSFTVTMKAIRTADAASDGVEYTLPLLPDREPVVERLLLELANGTSGELPGPKEAARPGSIRRQVMASTMPETLRLAATVNVASNYPWGCAEQRISIALANLALQQMLGAQARQEGEERFAESLRMTNEWLTKATDNLGRVSFWPGGRGSVYLTALAVRYLAECKAANLPYDEKLLKGFMEVLRRALRSDSGLLIDGYSYFERSQALIALAEAGAFDPAYARELLAKAPSLDTESLATVLAAYAQAGRSQELKQPLTGGVLLPDLLWGRVQVQTYQGEPMVSGFQDRYRFLSPWMLTHDNRTLAQTVRAALAVELPADRQRLLQQALLRRGQSDGWGSVNANAAAAKAVAEVLTKGNQKAAEGTLSLGETSLAVNATTPLAQWETDQAEKLSVQAKTAGGATLGVVQSLRSLPAAPGSKAAGYARGLAVSTEWCLVGNSGEVRERTPLDTPGLELSLPVGTVVEHRLTLVCPEDYAHVAVSLPFAAGLEPLNEALANAPPEARPSSPPSTAPTYTDFLDDRITWFYDELPAGTHTFAVRTRAAHPGRFTLPPGNAALMYDAAVAGAGNGAAVSIAE